MEVQSFFDIVGTGSFILSMAGLFIASIVYNMVVEWLHQKEWMEPYTWLTVVIGVGYTLIGAMVAMRGVVTTSTTAIFVVMLVFCVTGLPMSLGDMRRYWSNRKVTTS